MRYLALRFIIAVHYVAAVLGAVAVFVWLKALHWSSVPATIVALLVPVGTVAVAEVLRVLLAIESHTRRLASASLDAPAIETADPAVEPDLGLRGGATAVIIAAAVILVVVAAAAALV